jgi:hypothetical protein
MHYVNSVVVRICKTCLSVQLEVGQCGHPSKRLLLVDHIQVILNEI